MQPDKKLEDEASALAQFQLLSEEFKKLGDWEASAEIIRGTVERVWKENGWDSESDQFAKRTLEEVSAIPPWDFSGRMGRFTGLIGERYAFDERQRQRFESSLYAETGWFLVKNFNSIWGQTRESIAARAAGQPFTPEMVARWTRESDGMLADGRERIDRIVRNMEKTMTPEQRQILRADLRAIESRRAFIDHIRERWARGEWRPEDWGLEHDPIQAKWAPNPPVAATQPAGNAPPVRPDAVRPHDETTWERYVREFIARYQLDDGQQEAARSILRELAGRAADYRASRQREFAAADATQMEALAAPLRRMFEELKSRLEPIPTSAQRAAASQRQSS